MLKQSGPLSVDRKETIDVVCVVGVELFLHQFFWGDWHVGTRARAHLIGRLVLGENG